MRQNRLAAPMVSSGSRRGTALAGRESDIDMLPTDYARPGLPMRERTEAAFITETSVTELDFIGGKSGFELEADGGQIYLLRNNRLVSR